MFINFSFKEGKPARKVFLFEAFLYPDANFADVEGIIPY